MYLAAVTLYGTALGLVGLWLKRRATQKREHDRMQASAPKAA